MKTTNPFNHPFPHAKLDDAQLTSIKRLSKPPEQRLPMVGDSRRDIYDQTLRKKDFAADEQAVLPF
jgi:hypothetical protein